MRLKMKTVEGERKLKSKNWILILKKQGFKEVKEFNRKKVNVKRTKKIKTKKKQLGS
jgi:hypothetical protein